MYRHAHQFIGIRAFQRTHPFLRLGNVRKVTLCQAKKGQSRFIDSGGFKKKRKTLGNARIKANRLSTCAAYYYQIRAFGKGVLEERLMGLVEGDGVEPCECFLLYDKHKKKGRGGETHFPMGTSSHLRRLLMARSKNTHLKVYSHTSQF